MKLNDEYEQEPDEMLAVILEQMYNDGYKDGYKSAIAMVNKLQEERNKNLLSSGMTIEVKQVDFNDDKEDS